MSFLLLFKHHWWEVPKVDAPHRRGASGEGWRGGNPPRARVILKKKTPPPPPKRQFEKPKDLRVVPRIEIPIIEEVVRSKTPNWWESPVTAKPVVTKKKALTSEPIATAPLGAIVVEASPVVVLVPTEIKIEEVLPDYRDETDDIIFMIGAAL